MILTWHKYMNTPSSSPKVQSVGDLIRDIVKEMRYFEYLQVPFSING